MAFFSANNKAQTSLEFAVLIICVVAALLGMQVYLKRAFQGKLRGAADEVGQQYSPRNTTFNWNTTSRSQSRTTSVTKSEWDVAQELHRAVDFNGNCNYTTGVGCNETDVYATETISRLIDSTNLIYGFEEVGPFGNEPLFE
jgi:uncharacterized protein (UPF0333 family)